MEGVGFKPWPGHRDDTLRQGSLNIVPSLSRTNKLPNSIWGGKSERNRHSIH